MYTLDYVILLAFNAAKTTFLLDSVFTSLIGLSIAWYFGSFIDAYSYLIGAFLGVTYARLLGNYVETIGKRCFGAFVSM